MDKNGLYKTNIEKTATGRRRDEVAQENIQWLRDNNVQPMTMRAAFERAKKR